MPKVIFKVPSHEEISISIYYLVKDRKENYKNNIFLELSNDLIDKIVNNNLDLIKEDIIKQVKEAHNILKLEKVKNEIAKIWQPLNDVFFDNLKKITGFDFPFDNVVVYISEIIRGMYSPENKVFINPMKNMISYVTAEEIFHLHYWHIFRQLIRNVEIPWRINKKVWEISEVIPDFVLTDDGFKPFGWRKNLHRNYPFIEKWKKKLLPIWKNKKDFKDFMIKVHSNSYLKEGEQTKISENIQKISKRFSCKNFELIFEILNWINKNIKFDDSKKKQVSRKRTADQILRDRFSTGCTDFTLIFLALARDKDIPSMYVEGYKKTKEEKIFGHVVAKCFIESKWYIVDPTLCYISLDNNACSFNRKYKILNTGLDAWDIGIYNLEDLKNLISRIKNKS